MKAHKNGYKIRETFRDAVQPGKGCGIMTKTRLLLYSKKWDFVGVWNNRFVVKKKQALYQFLFSMKKLVRPWIMIKPSGQRYTYLDRREIEMLVLLSQGGKEIFIELNQKVNWKYLNKPGRRARGFTAGIWKAWECLQRAQHLQLQFLLRKNIQSTVETWLLNCFWRF